MKTRHGSRATSRPCAGRRSTASCRGGFPALRQTGQVAVARQIAVRDGEQAVIDIGDDGDVAAQHRHVRIEAGDVVEAEPVADALVAGGCLGAEVRGQRFESG